MRSTSHLFRVAWLPQLAVTALCLAVHGCTGATGGAVELSWKLRPASGAVTDPNVPGFLECSILGMDGKRLPGTNPVDLVELDWQVGTNTGHQDFPCKDGHGVTGFDLPEGTALLSVRPLCGTNDPAPPAEYSAPAPEQRSVSVGNTISLGGVELVVEVSDCTRQACICH